VGFPAHVQGRELPWQVEAECANEYLYGGRKYLYVAARSRAPRRGREATIKTLHCSKFKLSCVLEYLYVATRGT
jgi:hypothetical protein